MQNLEASSLAILKATEDSDDIFGAAKKDCNSSDNGSPPTKKKKRSHKPRKVIKGQPRETPCVRCISRMADKGHEHVCLSQACKSPFFPSRYVYVRVDARPVLTTMTSHDGLGLLRLRPYAQ